MADLNERDAKIVQYLSEAYGKEKELETALQAHIAMTTRVPYRKRLQDHLRETKRHARDLERRIKKLGGGGQTLQTVVGKAMAAAKGPMHMVRGTGEQEKMLKNAKTEYFNEHEEIATYLSIQTLAEKVGDRETAKLVKAIRRDEERMAKFLETQIRSLTGAVVTEEVPAAQRNGARPRRSTKRSAAKRSTKKRSTAKRSKAKSPKRSTTKRSTKSKTKAKSRTKAKGGTSRKRSTKAKRARKPAGSRSR